ncbi:MAG TPA: T9SS type A sorting domain-containing protein [Bacteroidales bacterium]|nr:T9SS type A sorting domain-containing protein [Bacteroidales bacterium]HNS45974.1 T9SS type A sorting domain-containing protein [Bacteroidales bacterium]
MRKKLPVLLFLLLTGLFSTVSWAQCTPGDATTCPDPEQNGQVCPDNLPEAVAGQLYSQAFTILAPPGYPYNGDTIVLDHITLVEVTGLPEGFTWLSNVETNEFTVGTYYCVLLEGTPAVAGDHPLRITVDVYAKLFPAFPPIRVATVTDSTSLLISVKWDPNSIDETATKAMILLPPEPNPFSGSTRIGVGINDPGVVKLEVYDLVGQIRYSENLTAIHGANYFDFDGRRLDRGIYILKVSNGVTSIASRLIKTD